MAHTKSFRDLKKRLDWYIDDTSTEEQALMLFDMANEDISRVARYARVVEADFDKNLAIIPLPDDFINAAELKIKLDNETQYRRVKPVNLVQPPDFEDDEWYEGNIIGYEIFGNYIEIRPKLDSNGKLLLRYYAELPKVTSLNDSPLIPPRFYDLYPLYAAAKWFQNYQDELGTKNDYWGEYTQKLAEFETYTLIQDRKTKSKTVYTYRPWR